MSFQGSVAQESSVFVSCFYIVPGAYKDKAQNRVEIMGPICMLKCVKCPGSGPNPCSCEVCNSE